MPINFYPHDEDLVAGSILERLELLTEAAERYKAVVLDKGTTAVSADTNGEKKRIAPRDITSAYNWGGLAKILREIRELPEVTAANKTAKADQLTKLADVYEVLRGAKMPKLEAVRLALINEANQLRSSASQVA